MQKRYSALTLAAFAASFVCNTTYAADPNYYSKTNVLSGANQVAPSVNYGKGIVFGSVDTGISPWAGFSSVINGQGVDNIDKLNSGSCLNGSCTAGLYNTDQNGHGTFTASQIVGAIPNFDGNGNGISGVAAGGTVIGVQVLNAQGSGLDTDVAMGIRYAVDRGAQVINLSIGPSGGTSAQQAGFYNLLASAVNYAASKNVYVVFAGGNSSKSLAGGQKITGFTDAAIQRTLFVGSTDSKLKISSFSNKPGTGSFTSTTGQSVAYKNMWVMADGGGANFFGITDPVYGASNSNTGSCAGYICITQKVGTSMAAPQATGAIGLLLARWPVLITSGNAGKLLAQTAKDLGTKGIDTTYGSGFINLVAAFQPVGGLTAGTASGNTVAVSSADGKVSGGVVAAGALGSMPNVAAALRNYTVFDSFDRDFQMDLSGLVSKRPFRSSASYALTAPKSSVSAVRFADGRQLAFGSMPQDITSLLSRPSGDKAQSQHFISFTDAKGSTYAAGNGGFPVAASFGEAMWGAGTQMSGQSYNLGASNALLNLSGGGAFMAYGTPVNTATRFAVSMAQTTREDAFVNSGWSQADARALGAGVTHTFSDNFRAGLTLNALNEESGLLGSSYDSAGAIRFGDQNRSVSFGVSSALAITESLSFMTDAAITRSEGAGFDNSIVTNVTPIYGYSAGVSLVQRNAFMKSDELSFSVRAPLAAFSGSADIATASVDEFGNAQAGSQRVNLTPDGREVAFTANYALQSNDGLNWSLTASARRDADNIAGLNEANMLLRTSLSF